MSTRRRVTEICLTVFGLVALIVWLPTGARPHRSGVALADTRPHGAPSDATVAGAQLSAASTASAADPSDATAIPSALSSSNGGESPGIGTFSFSLLPNSSSSSGGVSQAPPQGPSGPEVAAPSPAPAPQPQPTPVPSTATSTTTTTVKGGGPGPGPDAGPGGGSTTSTTSTTSGGGQGSGSTPGGK